MLLCVVFLQRFSARAAHLRWGVCVCVCACAGLQKLHVIGWKHSEMAVWAVASPPALIDHLDPSDDFVGIERDLCVVS